VHKLSDQEQRPSGQEGYKIPHVLVGAAFLVQNEQFSGLRGLEKISRNDLSVGVELSYDFRCISKSGKG
jgi:hypothetical protein